MDNKTHATQGSVHWLCLLGSANPARAIFEDKNRSRIELTNRSYASAESGLALPVGCQEGTETHRYSMLTVSSSASG